MIMFYSLFHIWSYCKCQKSTIKQDDENIVDWGCFSTSNTGPIVRIKDILPKNTFWQSYSPYEK